MPSFPTSTAPLSFHRQPRMTTVTSSSCVATFTISHHHNQPLSGCILLLWIQVRLQSRGWNFNSPDNIILMGNNHYFQRIWPWLELHQTHIPFYRLTYVPDDLCICVLMSMVLLPFPLWYYYIELLCVTSVSLCNMLLKPQCHKWDFLVTNGSTQSYNFFRSLQIIQTLSQMAIDLQTDHSYTIDI